MRPKQKLMDPYDYFSSRIGIFLLVFVFFLAQELRAQRQTSLLPKRKKQVEFWVLKKKKTLWFSKKKKTEGVKIYF